LILCSYVLEAFFLCSSWSCILMLEKLSPFVHCNLMFMCFKNPMPSFCVCFDLMFMCYRNPILSSCVHLHLVFMCLYTQHSPLVFILISCLCASKSQHPHLLFVLISCSCASKTQCHFLLFISISCSCLQKTCAPPPPPLIHFYFLFVSSKNLWPLFYSIFIQLDLVFMCSTLNPKPPSSISHNLVFVCLRSWCM
jgi:hypothetical protein